VILDTPALSCQGGSLGRTCRRMDCMARISFTVLHPLPITAQVGRRLNRKVASIVASLHTPPRPLQGRAIRCNGCNEVIVWQRAATTGNAWAIASCNDCTGLPDRCKPMQGSNAHGQRAETGRWPGPSNAD
jgi:hypothetical protein